VKEVRIMYVTTFIVEHSRSSAFAFIGEGKGQQFTVDRRTQLRSLKNELYRDSIQQGYITHPSYS
jgi:hypothetical protein